MWLMKKIFCTLLIACGAAMQCAYGRAAEQASNAALEKVVVDTDIGDDIDDALALALLLKSPQVQLLAVTTAWGDTPLRAQLVDRFLKETGYGDTPVGIGIEKHSPKEGKFSQRRWAEQQKARPHPDAVTLLLETIRRYPEEVTLIAIAPLTNVAAAYDRDPEAFRKLKRIVMMGGSIHLGYSDLGYAPPKGPDAEYNIAMDPAAAQKVFSSGVDLYVMPLDSTQLKLDEEKRLLIFTHSSPVTDALTLLYQQWFDTTRATPTVFDAMAAAFVDDAAQCPVQAMRIRVNEQGYTRVEDGKPNAHVCLRSDSDRFFQFYLPILLGRGAAQHPPTAAH
jgi:inosine-uridine nucleoside N-ribohydrolase